MATSLYAEQEADFRFKGDYVKVDGTLGVDGAVTLDSGATISGSGITISSPTTTATKSLTINTAMTTHTGTKFTAPSGTAAGLAWTTGSPAFSNGQKFLVFTAGSTDYRIPVWLNA